LAALDSSTISRLQQTWSGVPQKNKIQLEAIRKLADHSRNYSEYRTKLRNTAPPAVPFLGLYLTDVTFCREGNPSHRASPLNADKKLINFNKYHKLARIVQGNVTDSLISFFLLMPFSIDMQRFQVPYNLKAIPEVQDYLENLLRDSPGQNDLQELYRRRYDSLTQFFIFAECSPSSLVFSLSRDGRLMRLRQQTCDPSSHGRCDPSLKFHHRDINHSPTSDYSSSLTIRS
jgi:hypothetical protein